MSRKPQVLAQLLIATLFSLSLSGLAFCLFSETEATTHTPLVWIFFALGLIGLGLLLLTTIQWVHDWRSEHAPRDLLNSVIENIPNMIFVKDARDLRFVQFNKAGENLLGYSRKDLIGKNDFDLFPKDEADAFTRNDRTVLAGGEAIDYPEEPLSTRFGTRYLHTKKIPILDQHGKAKYLLGISEDITEKKTLEAQRISLVREQLARSEAEKTNERLSFLAAASATLNSGFDLDSMFKAFAKVVISHFADWCTIDLINEDERKSERVVTAHRDPNEVARAVEFYKKFSSDERFSKNVGTQCVLRTGIAEIYPDIDEAFLSENFEDPETLAALRNFGMRSAMVVPIKGFGASVLGTITFASTLPERRYTDVDLSLARDLARSLSLSIENARLFNRAQDANNAKSTFLANMSHEIRTPLGAMLGYSELLCSDDSLVGLQRTYVAAILRNGKQLLEIVDEVLDLAKVESDRIHIEKITFSIKSLIQDVASLLHVKAAEKSLELRLELPADTPDLIVSDPTRVRQILMNVVGNAIKFTSTGSVTLSVRSKAKAQQERLKTLEISVEDTGIGISPTQQSHLFQPFTQADNSMTRRFGGTGLGLFLSRKLAQLLNGDLVLESSTPGKGSRFVLSFDVESAQQSAASEVPTRDEEHRRVLSEPAHAPHSQRVLLVDDSSDNRTLFRHLVSRLGYEVDVAASGSEALSRIKENNYDLIFLDIQMPEMDGFQTLQHLRSMATQVPVVALTAHAMKGFREKCLSEGFNDYLYKPVDGENLKSCLTRFSAGEGGAR